MYNVLEQSEPCTIDLVQPYQDWQSTDAEMRALFAAMDQLIFVFDSNGRHLKIPATNQRLFYQSGGDRIGKTLHDIFPKDTADQFLGYIRQALHSQKTVNVEYSLMIEGREVWSDASISPINQHSVVWVTRDITERKQADAALRESEAKLREQTLQLQQTLAELKQAQARLIQSEKMSSLGQLVAGIAHEINNPMSFIHTNLKYVREHTKTLLDILHLYQEDCPQPSERIQQAIAEKELNFVVTDLHKILRSMQVGTDRIHEIIKSLRNFSRLDESDVKTVDIHAGIDSTLRILTHRLKVQPNRPEIQIIKAYDNLPPVKCYPGQLNQVFMNILSNAIDALEEGIGGATTWVASKKLTPSIFLPTDTPISTHPVPQIKITTEMRQPNRIAIRIADNGKGIPSEVQQRMLDPFFTTKPVGKGTGMGLAISYQIIEKHQGQLTWHTTPGHGTEFVIEIPL